jgi:hypothetical protein
LNLSTNIIKSNGPSGIALQRQEASRINGIPEKTAAFVIGKSAKAFLDNNVLIAAFLTEGL